MLKKISIVIPAFNAMAHLPSALQSILAQTYTELEVLVVNDGSTDGTAEYVRSIEDPRVILIDNECNLGIVASLNRAIGAATGHYIARMDADDIALPRRLELQMKFLEAHNYDLVSATAYTTNKFPRRVFGSPMNHHEVNFALLFFNPIIHPLVFAKAGLLKANPYEEEFEWAEDYHLWTKLALQGARIGVDSRQLLLYRLHSGQVSVMKSQKQLALTEAVRKDYYEKSVGAMRQDGANQSATDDLSRLVCVARSAEFKSKTSPAVRGIALRQIAAARIDSAGSLFGLKSVYRNFEAKFGIADVAIAVAALLTKISGSNIPIRAVRRIFV